MLVAAHDAQSRPDFNWSDFAVEFLGGGDGEAWGLWLQGLYEGKIQQFWTGMSFVPIAPLEGFYSMLLEDTLCIAFLYSAKDYISSCGSGFL